MGQYGDKLIKTGKIILAHPGRMALLLFVSLVILSAIFLHKWNWLFALIISVFFFMGLKLLKWFLRVVTRVENNLLINLGFQEIDLDEMDWGCDEIQKILNTLLHANNDAVLKQMRAIYRNYTENYNVNPGAQSSSPGTDLSSYVMSFAFSKELLSGNVSLKGMLIEEMRSIIINDISYSIGKNPDTEFKSEIRSAILLEIWFADIPVEKCYWLMKPYIGGEKIQVTHGIRVKPEGKMAGVALVSQNYNSTDGSFDIDDKKDKIAFNKKIPVMIGPRSLETGVIDIYSKTVCGHFTMNDLMQDLYQKLLLDVNEYNSPFPMINRWVSDKGGFIEFVGHFNAGRFFPAQKNKIYQSTLKKNLPNIFQNADIPIVSGTKKVENLLQEFVIANQPIVQGTLAGEGNFEIEYRKSQNGRKRQYHIKKLNWMTKYCPKDNYNSNTFSDWKNYYDFSFDQDNYAPIPFTEGYLMTGPNENEWLCLFLAAGSPADAGDGFSKGAAAHVTV
ncbi:MAG: hypothetical protein MUF15_18745, partial [Acidobacteria bacterium]|nr:hypothetical protein [Acidobacteriota bacterium]